MSDSTFLISASRSDWVRVLDEEDFALTEGVLVLTEGVLEEGGQRVKVGAGKGGTYADLEEVLVTVSDFTTAALALVLEVSAGE
jgi:hypothetical protein